MGRSAIQNIKLSENLTLSECYPDSECHQINWWLYDKRAGMNLGVRKPSKEAAMAAAVDYWARKYSELNERHQALCKNVDQFVNAVCPPEGGDW